MVSMNEPELGISVVLPSYGRPRYLHQCLQDLLDQTCSRPFEVIVVVRAWDKETIVGVRKLQPGPPGRTIRLVTVQRPGLMTALGAGALASAAELVAFCDDDARYPSFWLQTIIGRFGVPSVGAVGGPIEQDGFVSPAASARNIARLSWYGRSRQNAYAAPAFGKPVEVDFLCGANMAFRRSALSAEDFDVRLDSSGYSPGNEIAICAGVRKRGFRILYDPRLVVRHLAAPWIDARRGQTPEQVETYSRNIAYLMRRILSPVGKAGFLIYFWMIGQWSSPGILLGAIGVVTRRAPCKGWMAAAMRGKRRGWILAGMEPK